MSIKAHVTHKQLGNGVYVLNDYQLKKVKEKGYQPFGYNAGVYGWNYDDYFIGNNYVVYGYRPLLKWSRITNEMLNNLINQ